MFLFVSECGIFRSREGSKRQIPLSAWTSAIPCRLLIYQTWCLYVWCIKTNGVLWLIPARNFTSSPWVRATPPSGIFAPSSGGLIPDGGADFFHYKFYIKINEKHHLNPWRKGKITIFICFLVVRINPWRRGQIMFITIIIHHVFNSISTHSHQCFGQWLSPRFIRHWLCCTIIDGHFAPPSGTVMIFYIDLMSQL